MSEPPNLRLVTPDDELFDHSEFIPLPHYSWDIRPSTIPLDYDECATALALANGDEFQASQLLKVPLVRFRRSARLHPRLIPLLAELQAAVVARAASIPISTLFDPSADARRLEWASTKILASRAAASHPFSPAPAATTASSLTLSQGARTITYRWRTDADGPDA